MNWSKCPCCGYPCETLFISVECINSTCQNFNSSSLTRYETVASLKNNSIQEKDDLYDEDYGYPLYGFWNHQDND